MSERERDEEQKDAASNPKEETEQSGTEGSESQEPSEEMLRRAFIRKSAEVAALSLFGVMGLDAVVQSVLGQLEEISAMRSFARTTAEMLHQAGIGTMAFAQAGCRCAVLTPPFRCNDPSHPFTCAPNNRFLCPPANRFECNAFNFLCDINGGAAFVCQGTGHQCTNPAGQQFYCQAGFLCPSQSQYSPMICNQQPFQCSNEPNSFNWTCQNTSHNCPGTNPYTCGVAWIFDCGGQGQGGFTCDSGRFKCNGGTLYDFRCYNNFRCQGGFDCLGNHLFACGWPGGPADFDCAGVAFRCSAGGNRCWDPATGAYQPLPGDDIRPGDFDCVGGSGAANFDCLDDFRCDAVDDFICTGVDQQNFNCPATFLCNPVSGGHFRCQRQQPVQFTCNPTFSCPANQYSSG